MQMRSGFTVITVLIASTLAVAGQSIDEIYESTAADRSVDKALEYLARTQSDDGSWRSPSYGVNTGVCALATMAFMARGHTPNRGPYAEVLQKAVKRITDSAKDSGLLVDRASHGEMYSHGIASILLAEAIGMTDSVEVRNKLDKAIELILKAQNVRKSSRDAGGWRYKPSSRDSDISCTGWQLVALRAAKNAGRDVPKNSIDRAIDYLERCEYRHGGFGYQPGGSPNVSRTGTGTLSLQLCGEYDSESVRRGADYLLRNPPRWQGPFFFYGIYYSTQAMFQAGDKYWDFWKPGMEELLVNRQNPDGSWSAAPNTSSERGAGPVYYTAMCSLALSVQYRYLPIYQR